MLTSTPDSTPNIRASSHTSLPPSFPRNEPTSVVPSPRVLLRNALEHSRQLPLPHPFLPPTPRLFSSSRSQPLPRFPPNRHPLQRSQPLLPRIRRTAVVPSIDCTRPRTAGQPPSCGAADLPFLERAGARDQLETGNRTGQEATIQGRAAELPARERTGEARIEGGSVADLARRTTSRQAGCVSLLSPSFEPS